MITKNQKSPEPSDQSVHRSVLDVENSPFNTVKLQLGITLVVGFVLWLSVDFITASVPAQIILLSSYGFLGATWLVIRTREIIKQHHQIHNQSEVSDTLNSPGPLD